MSRMRIHLVQNATPRGKVNNIHHRETATGQTQDKVAEWKTQAQDQTKDPGKKLWRQQSYLLCLGILLLSNSQYKKREWDAEQNIFLCHPVFLATFQSSTAKKVGQGCMTAVCHFRLNELRLNLGPSSLWNERRFDHKTPSGQELDKSCTLFVSYRYLSSAFNCLWGIDWI